MCASKTIFASPDPTALHLPNVRKKPRKRAQHSPTPSSLISVPTTTVSTSASENVSALKAKYTGYASWLKASSRQNREPVFTHELLKHSLCQMGIDSTQASQLVQTCTWYVYQFQKGLDADVEHSHEQPLIETKKPQQFTKKRLQRKTLPRSGKLSSPRDYSPESEVLFASASKENFHHPPSRPVTQNKLSVLPSIHPSEQAASSRARRVDFDNEYSTVKPKSSQQRLALSRKSVLPKIRPLESDSAISFTNEQSDVELDYPPVDFETSYPNRNLHRNTIVAGQTRSILRKQTSANISDVSLDVNTRKQRHRLLTPTSTSIDEIPLGTKSQRLFGGSAYFAQIMNELEEQNIH
ncbi:unnamed protein product [Adineta ricciae]|uniref:Uncharacterized protein n=1 Tax=Adineta ricciae TaxID=249248 RepID=A0A814DZE7_ADIRI|nr:unnamed protein product [Adineta ricciae]CAF0960303.1 unnamed protein product [Adineta ricciae]